MKKILLTVVMVVIVTQIAFAGVALAAKPDNPRGNSQAMATGWDSVALNSGESQTLEAVVVKGAVHVSLTIKISGLDDISDEVSVGLAFSDKENISFIQDIGAIEFENGYSTVEFDSVGNGEMPTWTLYARNAGGSQLQIRYIYTMTYPIP